MCLPEVIVIKLFRGHIKNPISAKIKFFKNYFLQLNIPWYCRIPLEMIYFWGSNFGKETTIHRPLYGHWRWYYHRDRCIHIEKAWSVKPVDKFKLVFISCRFNISWIRKTVYEFFLSISKMPKLSMNSKCSIYLGIF